MCYFTISWKTGFLLRKIVQNNHFLQKRAAVVQENLLFCENPNCNHNVQFILSNHNRYKEYSCFSTLVPGFPYSYNQGYSTLGLINDNLHS